jgi:hypothetical protein
MTRPFDQTLAEQLGAVEATCSGLRLFALDCSCMSALNIVVDLLVVMEVDGAPHVSLELKKPEEESSSAAPLANVHFTMLSWFRRRNSQAGLVSI